MQEGAAETISAGVKGLGFCPNPVVQTRQGNEINDWHPVCVSGDGSTWDLTAPLCSKAHLNVDTFMHDVQPGTAPLAS